jgi:branched-chain amino acid transport system permease protein
VQGLLLGGLYALFALGQSLMFGVMRLTNTAQGDFIVLGAFGAIAALAALGPLLPAPQIALVVVGPAAPAGRVRRRLRAAARRAERDDSGATRCLRSSSRSASRS